MHEGLMGEAIGWIVDDKRRASQRLTEDERSLPNAPYRPLPPSHGSPLAPDMAHHIILRGRLGCKGQRRSRRRQKRPGSHNRPLALRRSPRRERQGGWPRVEAPRAEGSEGRAHQSFCHAPTRLCLSPPLRTPTSTASRLATDWRYFLSPEPQAGQASTRHT
jgi:hypothetical protein